MLVGIDHPAPGPLLPVLLCVARTGAAAVDTRLCSVRFLLEQRQTPLFPIAHPMGPVSSGFGLNPDDLGHRILK